MNQNEVEKILQSSKDFSKTKVKQITKIKGDASGRVYSRIYLENSKYKTAVLMELAGGKGPRASGDTSLDEDQTFVNIAEFFAEHNISAPKILVNKVSDKILIVEDAGFAGLNDICFGTNPFEIEKIFQQTSTLDLFKQAVDILAKLQTIEKTDKCIAYRRFLSFEDYFAEASSVITNFLEFESAKVSHRERTKELLEQLCENIKSHPTTFVHRDFFPWNLQITPDAKICVIDFQDALTASSEFDIVCLLHDRDIDFKIGDETCSEVVKYYQQELNRTPDFIIRYEDMLLHRYLRLTGHFGLLTRKWNNPVYAGWVPGCIRRVARVLAKRQEYADLIDILANYSDEVRIGVASPLKLID